LISSFENGTLYSATGGVFQPYNGGDGGPRIQDLEVANIGANGTNMCLKDTVSEGSLNIYYFPLAGSKVLIPQASGATRLSFFIKLPKEFPQMADTNFHIGTYTRDPINGSHYSDGTHYYHYFNIPGSEYWTKVICNRHPQHLVGVKIDPGINPTSWEYYDGFTRFYFDVKGRNIYPMPWVGYIDEVTFYKEDEPENEETINSVSCTYFGNGRFQIGWHGNSQYSHNGHRYEVRYSTKPILNSNYNNATVVPGGPFSLVRGAYNFIKADFTISVQYGTRYYFAIKDLDSNIPYVTKIDYYIESRDGSASPVDLIPPSAPKGLNIDAIGG